MKRALILLPLLLLSLGAQGQEAPKRESPPKPPTALEAARASLPEALRGLRPGVSTRAEVRKSLGKAAEEQGDHWRYDLGGGKFDTTIRFMGSRVAAIHHRVAPGKLSFTELAQAGLAGTDGGDPAERAHLPHELGRERDALYPQEGLRLRYRANGAKPVVEISLTLPR